MTVKNIKLDGKSLPLREFDLKNMVQDASIVMVAKRASGKSWVCRAILRHFKDIPGGVIISPTELMNSFYGDFFPDIYIHYKYTPELIESIITRQKQMIYKQQEKAKQGKKIDVRALIVMDDCLADKGSWANDPFIALLMLNGRHYRLMYILTMQFPLGIKPELRCNFDYIFLLAEDFCTNQKRIYEHYAGMFPSFKAFKDVFMDVTDDFGCMVIANRGARRDILDKVFWFKAKNEEVDMMGSKQFNKFHKDNFNKDWDNPNFAKKFNANDYFSNKRDKFKVSKIDANMDIGDTPKNGNSNNKNGPK